jgi:hypothetical protein
MNGRNCNKEQRKGSQPSFARISLTPRFRGVIAQPSTTKTVSAFRLSGNRNGYGCINGLLALWLTTTLCSAQTTNVLSVPSPLPDMGFSVVRVFGSLVVV